MHLNSFRPVVDTTLGQNVPVRFEVDFTVDNSHDTLADWTLSVHVFSLGVHHRFVPVTKEVEVEITGNHLTLPQGVAVGYQNTHTFTHTFNRDALDVPNYLDSHTFAVTLVPVIAAKPSNEATVSLRDINL